MINVINSAESFSSSSVTSSNLIEIEDKDKNELSKKKITVFLKRSSKFSNHTQSSLSSSSSSSSSSTNSSTSAESLETGINDKKTNLIHKLIPIFDSNSATQSLQNISNSSMQFKPSIRSKKVNLCLQKANAENRAKKP